MYLDLWWITIFLHSLMKSLVAVLSSPFLIVLVWSDFLLRSSANAQQCTMCLNGEEVDPLFGEKPLGLTVPIAIPHCDALLSILGIVPEDDELCVSLRYVGTYCGCPRALNSCQLCPASRPVMKNKDANLEFLLDSASLPAYVFAVVSGWTTNGGSLTCDLLDSAMSTFTKDDPVCVVEENLQAMLQTLCGCTEEDTAVDNDDQQQSCSFCAGDEDLPYVSTTSSVRFQDPTSEPIPCSTLFDMALETEPGTSLCTSIQQHTYSCGCPERKESACKLCEGEMLNEESLLDVDGVATNCQNYESKLRTMSLFDQKCVVNADIIEQCGCVNELPPNDDQCSLCPGGKPVGLPDKDISIIFEGILDSFVGAHPNYTCGVVQAAVSFETKDSLVCESTKYLAKACGCPARKGSCNLCGQSANIMTKPETRFIAGYNDVIARYSDVLTDIYSTGPTVDRFFTNRLVSCEFVDSIVNYLTDEGDQESCFPLQLQSSHHCGCDPPNQKGVALLWTQRSFAIVSMMVSTSTPCVLAPQLDV